MTQDTGRGRRGAAQALLLLAALATALPAQAGRWDARREFREGQREIARERREMRRDILRADSPREARQAYREGQREIAQERREMRREVRRELRYGGWDSDRNRVGEIIAGVALGAIIVSVARGVAPPPPSPELCWFWTDTYQERGYWDRCRGYDGY
ncbi:MAG: hypothetical protein ACRC2B_06200 [Rubrivivax sp.]